MIDPVGSPPGPVSPDAVPESAFRRVSTLLRAACGIHLTPGKKYMVESRLSPRLRELRLPDLNAYLDYVESDPSRAEMEVMVDLLTTNKTGFFRESRHFDHLVESLRRTTLLPGVHYRIWSAACSSGEEPYSIAMACLEAGLADVEILATDISHRVIAAARRGEYSDRDLHELPPALRNRYLEPVGQDRRGTAMWRVSPPVRDLVSFAHLNLQDPWPMRGPFDAIFCRNVMMYFDWETQSTLVARLDRLLKSTGHLYVGLSECLGAKAGAMKLVEAAVYSAREEAA